MNLVQFHFQDRAQAEIWVKQEAQKLEAPGVVLLDGPMGAGKTQFVRWFLKSLGATDVASPTFGLHHSYSTSKGMVEHLDLYRLESDQDLESSGFFDLLEKPMALMFVEWAERLPMTIWPKHWWVRHLRLSMNGIVGGPVGDQAEERLLQFELKRPVPK